MGAVFNGLQGGWDNAGIYEPGESAYVAYFDRMARMVTGCAPNATAGGDKIIMGPSWDNVSISEGWGEGALGLRIRGGVSCLPTTHV